MAGSPVMAPIQVQTQTIDLAEERIPREILEKLNLSGIDQALLTVDIKQAAFQAQLRNVVSGQDLESKAKTLLDEKNSYSLAS